MRVKITSLAFNFTVREFLNVHQQKRAKHAQDESEDRIHHLDTLHDLVDDVMTMKFDGKQQLASSE